MRELRAGRAAVVGFDGVTDVVLIAQQALRYRRLIRKTRKRTDDDVARVCDVFLPQLAHCRAQLDGRRAGESRADQDSRRLTDGAALDADLLNWQFERGLGSSDWAPSVNRWLQLASRLHPNAASALLVVVVATTFACSQALSPAPAWSRPDDIQYLAFQVFTDSSSPQMGAGGQATPNGPPARAMLDALAVDLITRVGAGDTVPLRRGPPCRPGTEP